MATPVISVVLYVVGGLALMCALLAVIATAADGEASRLAYGAGAFTFGLLLLAVGVGLEKLDHIDANKRNGRTPLTH